jgi:hypothetical protein
MRNSWVCQTVAVDFQISGFDISTDAAFGVEIFQAGEDLIGQNEDSFEQKPGVMAVQKNFEGIFKEI